MTPTCPSRAVLGVEEFGARSAAPGKITSENHKRRLLALAELCLRIEWEDLLSYYVLLSKDHIPHRLRNEVKTPLTLNTHPADLIRYTWATSGTIHILLDHRV